MTYRERLMSEHPELDERAVQEHVDYHCPVMSVYDNCFYDSNGDYDCDKCWDQVIPGTATEKEEPHPESEFSCDSCIHKTVCKYRDTFTKAFDIIKDIPEWAEVIIRCKYNL